MSAACSSPHAQTARGLVLAVVSSGSATLAHALGGGHLVSGVGVVVATAVLTGASLPFVRTPLDAARAAALLAALQVAAHVLHGLAALAAGGPVHAATTPTHEAHGIRPLGRIATATGAHDGAPGGLADLLPSPTMLLAHTVAAAVVGVLLTHGEQSWLVTRALLAPLAARAARLVDALTGTAALLRAVLGDVAARLRDPRPTTSDGSPPVDVWHARTPVRRGPPTLLA